MQSDNRRHSRVDVTSNRRELQKTVEQQVFAGEERDHGQYDNKYTIEEDYAEVAVFVALFISA